MKKYTLYRCKYNVPESQSKDGIEQTILHVVGPIPGMLNVFNDREFDPLIWQPIEA